MATPAPALVPTPSVTIRIQNGVPNLDSVSIKVGQLVEFHNEDNTPYQLPVSYLDGGSDDNYPLAILLPAGGKVGFIGVAAATCEYTVAAVSTSASDVSPAGGPPYTIIVSSGEPEADA
jgi:hypothetical protein